MKALVKPTLEAYSDKKAGTDFDVCVNPEFLREGTSIKDFYAPPFTIIGAIPKKAARFFVAFMKKLTRRFMLRASKSLKWSSIRVTVFTA
ncbi:MAG: hypothetical protein WKF71_05790 [Pyrinomonadaceae bacterium]